MNRFTSTGLLAFSLALIAIAPAAANAQQGNDPAAQMQEHSGNRRHAKHDPHKTAMHLGKKLGLSSDQTTKLEPILTDRQQKVAALRADTSLSKDQRREQMRSIRESTQQQMSTVLTPEQMEQLKSMHKEHRHHGSAPTGA